MSTAELERNQTTTDGGPRGGLGDGSLGDSLRFVATGLLPSLARGLFSPRPRAMKLLTRLNTDARAIRALAAIRDKRGGEGVRLLRGKMVVLWGERAIREVLDNSATTYASDAGAKAKGMSHFQPDALTLSRGEDWRDRRKFNESVLATSEKKHPDAERWRTIVDDEVDRMRIGDGLRWDDWERLWDHITLRVIFGDRARNDQDLTDALEKLMGQANRVAGTGPSELYYDFYGRLEKHLVDPEPKSLVARIADAPQSDRTRVAQQIPHWIFAMRDTLGANAYRALAAIVADPELERRVRAEIDAGGETPYLAGVLHEAMRAWPTTPLLAREVTSDTEIAGERVEEGTQVMLLNVFNHRDPARAGLDRLDPERWKEGQRDYRFNHLSNGTQDCPGGPIVLLLGTAVIARVLTEHRLRLEDSAIEPGKPLPEMLDFFQLRFTPA